MAGNVVLTEDLVAILPPGHPLSGEQSITLNQLKDDKFVLFSKGYSLRPIVWHACLEAGFTPKIAFEGEETDTIRGLVAAGMGVSLLPETALFQSFSLQPSRVRISVPKVTRTIGLIHRADEKLPLVAQSFRIFLLEYFGLQIDTPPSQ
ncbi:HTH-type transcriptional regulator GltC [compost metagenome]